MPTIPRLSYKLDVAIIQFTSAWATPSGRLRCFHRRNWIPTRSAERHVWRIRTNLINRDHSVGSIAIRIEGLKSQNSGKGNALDRVNYRLAEELGASSITELVGFLAPLAIAVLIAWMMILAQS